MPPKWYLAGLISPLLLATVLPAAPGWAQTQSPSPVTSVSQLADVQPTDWAFQALQSLVERYGCIAGYPNSTFRGNRAMTRYEFAAGLNACLNKMSELIQAGDNQVRQEDLAALQKLEDEFNPELAALHGRVDSLEARTAKLEAQQFSPTTKLTGTVVFGLADASSINGNSNQTVFQSRVRLLFSTSFTGQDLLSTRLTYSNSPLFGLTSDAAGNFTGEGRLSFQDGTGPLSIDWLAYQFPIGEKAQLYVAAVGAQHEDYVITTASPNDDENSGALSYFGQYNAIFDIGGDTGVGFTYNFTPVLGFNLGYLAGADVSNPSSPLPNNGLFNGTYGALAQLSFQPHKGWLQVALTYVNAYAAPGESLFNYGGSDGTGIVGTTLANFPGSGSVGFGTGVQSNSYGLSAAYQFTPHLILSAWGDYTNAQITHPASLGLNQGTGDIWAYALALNFPDAFRKGNMASLILGAEPYLANSKSILAGSGNLVPVHLEGYYRFQVNDFISVTPGIIYLVHPDQNPGPGAVIGAVRTTFTF